MSLFGYFDLGLRAMNAARLGLQVAGDNIANVFTPGYVRRRLELTTSYPVRIAGGMIDQGVEVARLQRMEDLFLQASLQKEQGRLGASEERLRGLRSIESAFGTLEGEGINSALARFTTAFDQLAGQPEDAALRREAVAAADALATVLRDTHARLQEQRRLEDVGVGQTVDRINDLAGELAELNREIATEEADGSVAAPLRDRRDQVVEELAELTGGSVASDPTGRVGFSLPSGPTLVSGDQAIPLGTSRAADGTLRIVSGADGSDVTSRLRDGRLGALLYVRDDAIQARLEDLDRFAADLATRANALTTGASDLRGDPGVALFLPDPPPASGAAGKIAINPLLLDDPSLLAVSGTGAPGDGEVARSLAALADEASAGLGDRSLSQFISDGLSSLGTDIVQADVEEGVARDLVDGLRARRDAVAGVSLDEEAVELIRNQRAFEAAARFLQVMNSITETAIRLGGR